MQFLRLAQAAEPASVVGHELGGVLKVVLRPTSLPRSRMRLDNDNNNNNEHTTTNTDTNTSRPEANFSSAAWPKARSYVSSVRGG